MKRISGGDKMDNSEDKEPLPDDIRKLIVHTLEEENKRRGKILKSEDSEVIKQEAEKIVNDHEKFLNEIFSELKTRVNCDEKTLKSLDLLKSHMFSRYDELKPDEKYKKIISDVIKSTKKEIKKYKETSNLTFPEYYMRAKDKVTQSVFNNELTVDKFEFVKTYEPKKGNPFGALVKVDGKKFYECELSNDGQGNKTVAYLPIELTDDERMIFDAFVALYKAGNSVVTPNDVNKVIKNYKTAKLHEKREQEIIKSVDKLSSIKVIILSNDTIFNGIDKWRKIRSKARPEKQLYDKIADKYEGYLLPVEKSSTPYKDEEGQFHEKDVKWKILKLPALYEYAEAKKQISTTAMKVLKPAEPTNTESGTSKRRSGKVDELRIFLVTNIDTMNKTKNSKKPYSRIITCDELYKVGGVDKKLDDNTKNVLKSRTRKKVEGILNLLLKNGAKNFIGYEWHKKTVGKATTYHSIEILLPTRRKS